MPPQQNVLEHTTVISRCGLPDDPELIKSYQVEVSNQAKSLCKTFASHLLNVVTLLLCASSEPRNQNGLTHCGAPAQYGFISSAHGRSCRSRIPAARSNSPRRKAHVRGSTVRPRSWLVSKGSWRRFNWVQW